MSGMSKSWMPDATITIRKLSRKGGVGVFWNGDYCRKCEERERGRKREREREIASLSSFGSYFGGNKVALVSVFKVVAYFE